MIEGVTLRDVVVRTDERGHLAELYSTNFGDEDLCHFYRCMVRPGVVKAFHCHVGLFDEKEGSWGEGQADRFAPMVGVTKAGLVDLRGPVVSQQRKLLGGRSWKDDVADEEKSIVRDWFYLGIDGRPMQFCEVWPTDDAWIKRVGESPTFLEQQSIVLDSSRPQVLTIPPGIAHGIYSLTPDEAEIINAPTKAYADPPDELRIPAESFGFEWSPRSR